MGSHCKGGVNIELYNHQKDVLNKTSDKNKVAYYLDLGLGKTVVGSHKATSYDNKILLVCPKCLIPQWISHFELWHKGLPVYDLTKKKQFDSYLSDKGKSVGIINYESVWRKDELKRLSDLTLVLDESQAISNSTSKQTKGIVKLKYTNLVLLSGTPCSSARYDKLYTQLKMLGMAMNKREYEDRYCNFFDMETGGIKFRVLSKTNPYKNVDELKEMMDTLGCVFMKTSEVLSLPEQVFIKVPCKITKEYQEFNKNDYLDLGDEEFISTGPTDKLLYLRYLAGAYNKNKVDQLKTLLESSEDKMVIFYTFNKELEVIESVCKKLKRHVAVVNGQRKELSKWRDIIVCQYQSASSGLNLQQANKLIYFSLPNKSDFFEQSKKRIHRIGTKNTCFYYLLLTDNSVDCRMYSTLELKRDYNDELFRREEKQWK